MLAASTKWSRDEIIDRVLRDGLTTWEREYRVIQAAADQADRGEFALKRKSPASSASIVQAVDAGTLDFLLALQQLDEIQDYIAQDNPMSTDRTFFDRTRPA